MPYLADRLRRLAARCAGQRGDVPGWVLVTAMTVALVMLIYGIASETLQNIVESALNSVSFGGGGGD